MATVRFLDAFAGRFLRPRVRRTDSGTPSDQTRVLTRREPFSVPGSRSGRSRRYKRPQFAGRRQGPCPFGEVVQDLTDYSTTFGADRE